MFLYRRKTSTEFKYIRFFLTTLLCICLCIFLLLCSREKEKITGTGANITKNNYLVVDYLNVGKGDCMLIQSKTHTYLIDTGYEETADEVTAFLKSKNIKKLDGMIITHYDKDHIGGAKDIVKNFDVNVIYMPKYDGTGSIYQKFMDKLNKWNKLNLISYVTDNIRIEFDGIIMDIYPAKETFNEDDNDNSLVTKIVNNNDSFLFTGDIEDERISELLGDSMIKADVLKVPYHGRLEDNTIQFIDESAPEYAIITCESESKVSTSLIYELEKLNVKYYFNCNGNIRCDSDGTKNIKIEQNK